MAGEKFINWIREKYDSVMSDDKDLIALKADDLPAYKEAIWKKFEVIEHAKYTDVFIEPDQWFVGSTLNYAEHIFRNKTEEKPAITFILSNGEKIEISWQELLVQTTSFADYLNYFEIKPGDVVAGVTANSAEQIMALLACSCIGAVWSNLAPETSEENLINAFKDLKPRLLIASESYHLEKVQTSNVLKINNLTQSLESITQTVVLPSLPPLEGAERVNNGKYWNDTFSMAAPALSFKAFPYGHPLCITFEEDEKGNLTPYEHSQGELLLNGLAQVGLQQRLDERDTKAYTGPAAPLLLGASLFIPSR